MRTSSMVSIIFLGSIFLPHWANVIADQAPKEVENWFKKLAHGDNQEKMTKLHFYFHDLLSGKNVTSVHVAQANMTGSSPTFFGSFIMADDPLTVGPGIFSKRVGYAKGFYGAASLEEVGLVMAMTFVFTDGQYNGSSISILGHNPNFHMYREIPIVGGSGHFRLARGVATWQTYFYNPAAGNATVEIDVFVLHY